MNRFLHRCLTRTPLIGVLMAALVFRALIPADFMLMQGEGGSLVMQLCSGFEGQSVVIDLAEAGTTNDTGNTLFEHSPCGFTVSSSSAPPPSVVAFPVAAAPQSPAVGCESATIATPSIARAQSPRAPPLI